MENEYMLTTFDNPFSPFDDFDNWFKTDHILQHYCCETLARESNVSDVASDDVNEKAIDEAMDRIIQQNPMIYKKVRKSDYSLAG